MNLGTHFNKQTYTITFATFRAISLPLSATLVKAHIMIMDLDAHLVDKSVTVDFTTHGGSHLYGLPYPSANSLDRMDNFCTFDVSKIIPKNAKFSICDF